MLNVVQSTTRMIIPASIIYKINYIDRYYYFYRKEIIISICLIGLVNSILLESITFFPVGWIFNGLIILMVESCCACLNRYIPHIFRMPNNDIQIYELLYVNGAVIHAALPERNCPIESDRNSSESLVSDSYNFRQIPVGSDEIRQSDLST